MISICECCCEKVGKLGALPREVLESICELCLEHEWVMYENSKVPSFFVTIVNFLEINQFLITTELEHGFIAIKPSGEFDDGVYCWCDK